MEEAVIELKYDCQKLPLGKLTRTQIDAGNAALKRIESCINRGHFGSQLLQAVNEFYTRIPHCFGFKQPPLIRTLEDVQAKMSLMDTLEDIEVAMKELKVHTDSDVNPLDQHYAALDCQLTPLDREDADFKMVDGYVQKTHAPTHKTYSMRVKNVFRCRKPGEQKRFKDLGNRMLLWHGSRLTNYFGILSKGLRVAPPEAPSTGYMFGKGIYFADMCSKSANYCFATKTKNTGFVLLCDVSLGKPRRLLDADYDADRPTPGVNSTHGLGRMVPDKAEHVKLEDGCVVPVGKPVNAADAGSGHSLMYNEFVIYDACQYKMKYLVELEFDFKF